MTSAPLPDLLRLLLVVVAVAAGVTDILWRKIPNWLALAAVIAGFAVRYYVGGTPGLITAAKGLGLAFLIYFPLWLLRAMGAGDVKLMAALGAIAGPGHWLLIFLAAGILGAVAAL